MKSLRIVFIFILISFTFSFADIIGHWSHCKEITSDYTVNAGDTLLINEGTEVRFAPGVKFNIYGVVISYGTEADPVTFSALESFDHTWGGVTINNSDPAQISLFEYTDFKNINSLNDGAIEIIESSVDFNNCKFIGNNADYDGGGIYILAGNVNLNKCEFEDNTALAGGAIYIYNNPSVASSNIGISWCTFTGNNAQSGGALYIKDYDGAMFDMSLNIEETGFYYNRATAEHGGGIYYNGLSHIELDLSCCKIQGNAAGFAGGGLFVTYNESYPSNVLPQEFSNLLITGNMAETGCGVLFNSGLIQNPQNISFINNTLAYNYIFDDFSGGGGGIRILSEGNHPLIKNSIIWNNGNEYSVDEFVITDATFPDPSFIFSYCDISTYYGKFDNISSDPLFIRPPSTISLPISNIDSYDFHLSLNSLCIDAGDPTTPINPIAAPEVLHPPVNIGAYGNTAQASLPLNVIIDPPDYIITVPDGEYYVINCEFEYDTIILGHGSQLYIDPGMSSSVNIRKLITPIQPTGKLFNDQWIFIRPLVSSYPIETQLITMNVTEELILHGVDMSEIQLTIGPDYPTASINNCKINNNTDFTEISTAGINLINATDFVINNTVIDHFQIGIQVISGYKKSQTYGRITNNTINFKPDVASKIAKKIGIHIENSMIEIDNNIINNADTSVELSTSEGRITDNFISCESDPVSKNKLIGKIALNILNESETVIEDNNIWITDTNTFEISAINIENSSAQIYYNKINFSDAGPNTRDGIVFNNIISSTYAYNNTIYNPTIGINNIPGTEIIDIINNIIWNDNYSVAITDTTNLVFLNNCINTQAPISGSGNIFSDPLCIDPSTNDLVISNYSHCINAGKIIDGFHIANTNYFGSAPDIGAYEYYENTVLAIPGNVMITHSDDLYTLSWDSVSGATYYNIYTSPDPYGSFTLTGSTANTSWSTILRPEKQFFYIVAMN